MILTHMLTYHIYQPLTVLGLLPPHHESIPSSNNYRQRIEETSLLLAMPSSLNPHCTFHPWEKNQRFVQREHQLWRVDSMFLQSLGLDYFQKMQVSWWNIWNLRNVPKKPPRDCQSWNTSRWPPEGSTCCRQCKVGLEGESLLMCRKGSGKRLKLTAWDVWRFK